MDQQRRDELAEAIGRAIETRLESQVNRLVEKAMRPHTQRLVSLCREIESTLGDLKEVYAEMLADTLEDRDESNWWKRGPGDDAD